MNAVQAHGCTHALLWTWQRDTWPAKDMGPQPVPHLFSSKFLLYVLNGLLSCTAVLMQPLWLSGDIPKPQQPFERPGASGNMPNPLPITLLPLPLQAQRSKSHPSAVYCAGVPWQHCDSRHSLRPFDTCFSLLTEFYQVLRTHSDLLDPRIPHVH